MSRISINAIKCEQNGRRFYITIMDSNILKSMCFISRKKEEPIKGFQRLLNRSRAKQIAAYLDTQKGTIPSAVILSAQPNAQIRFDASKNKISFEKISDSLMIIDGQHRLFGMFEASGVYSIPVIIFDNLKSEDEVNLFIDINTTQRGVPAALLLDIKSQAGKETKLEERQRLLFDNMNQSSVLSGYLLPNESKPGKISRPVFYECTKALFTEGPVSDAGDDLIYRTLSNYLEAVDRIFKETNNPDARINKSVLFKAVMGVFNDVCDKCLIKYGNLKSETIKDYLAPISQLNFDEYTGTNKATVSKITNEIKSLLKERVTFSEDMI